MTTPSETKTGTVTGDLQGDLQGDVYGVCFRFRVQWHYDFSDNIVETVGTAVSLFPGVVKLTDLPIGWLEMIHDEVRSHIASTYGLDHSGVDMDDIDIKIGCVNLVNSQYIGDEEYYDFVSR